MADRIDNLLKRLRKDAKRTPPVAFADRPPSPHHILTYTGKYIDPVRPHPDDLDILDIVHSLSNTARYGGHSNALYSVAQHSVMVANMLPREVALVGLLHDAGEAYLGDVPSPIKRRGIFREFRKAEDRLLRVILDKFVGKGAYVWPLPPEVVAADRRALHIEMASLMPPVGPYSIGGAPQQGGLECLEPAQARDAFLRVYSELSGVKVKSPRH